jgi:hypothetical protein
MASRQPERGPDGFGIASEFGSLDGWRLDEADAYLSSHAALRRSAISEGDYRWYKFEDRSEVWIRPNGEVIRQPKPFYEPDGRKKKGFRINIFTGQIIRSTDWHKLPRSEQEWVVIK